VHKLRVVVWGLPRLLSDIVSGIVRTRSRMQIVGGPEKWRELVEMAARKDMDVVVLGCEQDELSVLGNRLLLEHPRLKILAVSDDGRGAARYGLWPQRQPLREISPDALLEAMEQWPDWTREP